MRNHNFEQVNQRTKWGMFNSYAKLPEGTVWETSNNVYIIGL